MRLPTASPRRIPHTIIEVLETRIAPAGVYRWIAGNGNWNNFNNWSPVSGNVDQGFPNSPDDEARFTNFDATNHTITIPDGAQMTVGKITFDDDNDYGIVAAGTGSLVMESLGTSTAINVTNTSGNGTHQIAAPIILNGDVTISVTNSSAFTLFGAISEGVGTHGLTKAGTGTLVFAGAQANVFGGTTIVSEGFLSLSKSANVRATSFFVQVGDGVGGAASATLTLNADGQMPSSATVQVQPDGRLHLNNHNQTLNTLGLSASGGVAASVLTGSGQLSASTIEAFSLIGGGVPSITGKLGLFNTINVDASDADVGLTMDVVFSNGSILNKSGAGVLELTSATPQTYSGATTIDSGVLILNTAAMDAALSTNIHVNSGGTLRLVKTFQVPDLATVTVDGGKIEFDGVSDDWTTLNLSNGADVNIMPGGSFRLRPSGIMNVTGTSEGATIHGGGDFNFISVNPSIVVDDTLADADLTMDIRLTGSIPVALSGSGKTVITRAGIATGAITIGTGSTLELDNADLTNPIVLNGGTLAGSGSVKGITAPGGGRYEGVSLDSTDNVAFTAGLIYVVGSSFPPQVTGSVDVGGAYLAIALTTISSATPFTILENDGTDAITGTFAGLPEGAKLTSSNGNYIVTYSGGDGNDVALSAELVAPTGGGKSATFTDVDGDLVTVTTSKGTLGANNFVLLGAGAGALFKFLNLTTGNFDGAKITVTARSQGGAGDGHVDLASLGANNVDLAGFSLPGDLGTLTVGNGASNPKLGLGSLMVDSFGLQNTPAVPGSFGVSTVTGPVGVVKIKGAFQNQHLTINAGGAKSGSIFIGDTFGANALGGGGRIIVNGDLAAFTVLGDIVGGTGLNTGAVAVNGVLGNLVVGGSILGGGAANSGSVTASGLVSAKIGRDLRGGAGAVSGRLAVSGTTGTVAILGSVLGGDGSDSGQILATNGLAKLTINGDLRAGAMGTGTVESEKAIKSITIGGSVLGNVAPSIFAETLGGILIKRDFAGLGTARASIVASGVSNPADVKAATAIASLTVLGSVKNADLLAGYGDTGIDSQTNADVVIGKVAVKGNWENSRVLAGVKSANSIFGDAGDVPIGGAGNPNIHSRIAGIVIGGVLKGTAAVGDASGFVAQDIGGLTVGKIKFLLAPARFTDDLTLGAYGDIFVKEIPAI